MINYNGRTRRFSTMMSTHCRVCFAQTRTTGIFKGAYRVADDRVNAAAFFGVPYGPGMGTLFGAAPQDRAFQRAIYRAMIAHNRDAHPQNIDLMVRFGWIKKIGGGPALKTLKTLKTSNNGRSRR